MKYLIAPSHRSGTPFRRFRAGAWVAIIASCLSLSSAAAANTSIDVQPSTRSCTLNEVVLIQVVLKNPTQASMPEPPTGNGFEVRYSGANPSTSQTTTIVNGRMSQEVTYTYTFELTPLKTGRLDVGPFTWKDGPTTYRTRPFALFVKDAGDQPPLLYARVIAEREKVYVGEPIQIALEVFIRKYWQTGLGTLDARGTLQRLNGAASNFGIFSDATNSPPRYREDNLPADVQNGVGRNRSDNSEDYYVFIWEIPYIPRQPGKLDFSDIVIGCDYPVRLRQQMFFSIEDAVAPRRLRVRPDAPEIDVKPVPLAGRPDDYNGAIGSFQLTTQAAPTNVPVGDPITLTLNLKSSETPLEGLSAPKLTAIPALTRDFEVSGESLAGNVRGNTKVFSQTIRPLREDVKEIPPIPFSYFDPAREKYETAWSDPIPLNVKPAERVAIAAADEHDANATGMTSLVETTDGLQANHANIGAMLADQSAKIGIGTYVFLGAMPSLYLIGAIATHQVRKRRENAGARRQSGALRHAKSRIDAAHSAGDVLAAATGYIADRFNTPPGSVTRRDAVDRISRAGASDASASQLDSLLQGLEAAQYAGATGVNLDEARTRARSLLTTLDKEVKP